MIRFFLDMDMPSLKEIWRGGWRALFFCLVCGCLVFGMDTVGSLITSLLV